MLLTPVMQKSAFLVSVHNLMWALMFRPDLMIQDGSVSDDFKASAPASSAVTQETVSVKESAPVVKGTLPADPYMESATIIPHMLSSQPLTVPDFDSVARRVDALRVAAGGTAAFDVKIRGIRASVPYRQPATEQEALKNFEYWVKALDDMESTHLVNHGLTSVYIDPIPRQ